jgi:hypothetical protein
MLIKETLANNSPSDDQVRASTAELFLASDEAKYVLSRLATRMQTNTKEIAIDEANLEHIFPKNPKDNEWGGQAGHEQLEPYLWHIGNLTMLGERLNRTAQNSEYAVKKAHYEQKSELEMAQAVARTYNDWNVVNIEDRAKQLAPLVLEVWDFDNPSRV